MCGIFGLIDYQSGTLSRNNMAEKLSLENLSRGPDSGGVWGEDEISLAHRRLSIIDFSGAAHQPMISQNERYVLTFNGEIYNYLDVKTDLEKKGVLFRTKSDTEVLLESISYQGLEETLIQIRGMFAFGVYDRKEKKLFLARDRIGEKPLYYGWNNGRFYFASDLKPILKHPSFKDELSEESLSLYFKHNYVPTPRSIFKSIRKLQSGHFIEINVRAKNSLSEVKNYWDFVPSEKSLSLSYGDAKEKVEELLNGIIREQMISDVPIGAFLSGGVDSSAITALMQKMTNTEIRTFTIGFEDPEFNEAPFAKQVAKHLGTKHTELFFSEKMLLDWVPKMADVYAEPFSDSSQLPTTLLSHLTKNEVTVALSGDGGDEVFGGYTRYIWANEMKNKLSLLPHRLRRLMGKCILSVPEKALNSFSFLGIDRVGEKIHKAGRYLDFKDEFYLYDHLVSHWKNPPLLNKQFGEHWLAENNILTKNYSENSRSYSEKLMWVDAKNYLSDDIMVKVDRATMSASLESRAPFLDHRLIELMMNLPLDYKIKNGVTKKILRDILYPHVPKALIERPKKGFSVPLDRWLMNDLREYAEHHLSETSLRKTGFLDVRVIREKWNSQKNGKSHKYELWDVLMFQQWAEKYL